MTNLKIVFFLMLAIAMATSCKKNEETPLPDATAEEAAAIMATSFCTGNAGTMTQVEDAVDLSQSIMLKSSLIDSSFTITSLPGALIAYQYQMNYSFGFQAPNNFQLVYSASGNYDSPNVTAAISGDGTLAVTGFLTGDAYIVNGKSASEGNFATKIGNKNSITGTVSSTITNFRFSKTTGLPESGSATIVVAGSTGAGRSFGFTGTLVYNGNNNATLTINGKTFNFNVISGILL
ncbi:MAG: hypothetical protein NT004_05445 [Bacteroidetes bacterium]|nr:hypothetical protein [Bacteroidota bacterium]